MRAARGPAVRPATPGDVAAIAAVQVATWRAAYRGLVPDEFLAGLRTADRAAGWRARIEAADPAYLAVLTGELDGLVAGFAVAGPARDTDLDRAATGEIWAVYVHPEAQGYGLGRLLLTAALDRLADHGYADAVLWVLRANTAARGFYVHLGWAADGTERSLDLGRPVPEVRYRRTVPRPARPE